jgi:hypothetical protein
VGSFLHEMQENACRKQKQKKEHEPGKGGEAEWFSHKSSSRYGAAG